MNKEFLSIVHEIITNEEFLKLKKEKGKVKVGKKLTIKATATPFADITFKSTNKKIAKVSSAGVVTGKKKGTTVIKVTVHGVTKNFKVQVIS